MGTDKVSRATAPTIDDDKVYHLRLKKGDISSYVILPSDQATTLKISDIWEDVNELVYNREYKTVTGKYKGLDMAITSTGIGCQPAEICINELKKVGVHTCIKVGNVESIKEDLELGEIVIPVACMRKGGAVTHYVGPEFPAFANPRITKALIESCNYLGIKYTLGVICSISSYFVGQGRPINGDESSYWPPEAEQIVKRLQNAKIIAIDMETAGEFIMGFLHEIRMGAALSVNANRVSNTWGDNGGELKACLIASEAIRILQESDNPVSLKA